MLQLRKMHPLQLRKMPPPDDAATLTAAPGAAPAPAMPWEDKVGIATAAVVGAAALAATVADSVQPQPTEKPKTTTPEAVSAVPVRVPVVAARLYRGGNEIPAGSAPPGIVVSFCAIGAAISIACGLLGGSFIHYKYRKKRSTPIQIRAFILSREPDHPIWAGDNASDSGTEGWPLLA